MIWGFSIFKDKHELFRDRDVFNLVVEGVYFFKKGKVTQGCLNIFLLPVGLFQV